MDFDERPEHVQFRAEARSWLEANSEPAQVQPVPQSAIVAEWLPEEEHAKMAATRRWQRNKYDGGWAGITWPADVGGKGLGPVESFIFSEEEHKRDVPSGELAVGLGWLGPAINRHGSDAQRLLYLPPMLRGDEVWCQLFSEPGAGSDLAGLATTAVRDGDIWRIDGQKVWSTFAHMSDWGLLLARTDPDLPKHSGITAFVIDMHQEAVECRPLRQITGASNFNEVFFDGAIVSDDQRVGAVGEGWATAMTTFMHERSGGGGAAELGAEKLVEFVKECGAGDDPLVRQGVASVYSQARALEWVGKRVMSAFMNGRMPGPEAATFKLVYTNMATEMNNLSLAVQGAAGALVDASAPVNGAWQSFFLGIPGIRIGGGTDEIQRNIMSERFLGLPGDIRVDKDVAFKDVPR